MSTEEVLTACTVDGTTVKLPEIQLERKAYLDVSKRLELIGGKWNRKAQGFVFPADPTDLLKQIATGEQRNLKKEFQFFATPDGLADRLVDLALLQKEDEVLEPSAGNGSIVKAINRQYPNKLVDCYELMGINCYQLEKLATVNLVGNDFLQAGTDTQYDKIIANPPFSKNQDIDHIRKMFEVLKPGGRIVTVASKHWEHSSFKKETAFREWLDDLGAMIEPIESGEFKQSGTMVSANVIVIDK